MKRVLTMKRLRLCASARASSAARSAGRGSSRTCAVRGFHPAGTSPDCRRRSTRSSGTSASRRTRAARRSPSRAWRRLRRAVCPLPETLAPPPRLRTRRPVHHCGRTATRSSPRGSSARASSTRVRDRCTDSSAGQAHGGGVGDARCVRCRIHRRARGRTCRAWTRASRRAVADREKSDVRSCLRQPRAHASRVRDHKRHVRHVSGRRTRARHARTNEDGRHGTTTEEERRAERLSKVRTSPPCCQWTNEKYFS